MVVEEELMALMNIRVTSHMIQSPQIIWFFIPLLPSQFPLSFLSYLEVIANNRNSCNSKSITTRFFNATILSSSEMIRSETTSFLSPRSRTFRNNIKPKTTREDSDPK
ncbi:hypothetical protein HanPI659440_Chr13g0491461 [Helianthus annuus]|nr:hypothetical protein HanPI659440_Chr13g0491461 [Helianthus annuus]